MKKILLVLLIGLMVFVSVGHSALIKDKQVQGVNAYCHKIVDCNIKDNYVMVASYASKSAAQKRENMLGGRTKVYIDFNNPDEDLMQEAMEKSPSLSDIALTYAYLKMVEPKPKEVTDEEGNVTIVETNWFADAVSDDTTVEEPIIEEPEAEPTIDEPADTGVNWEDISELADVGMNW